jgi:C4-dicarboxylate-specific signal transduction histidine kinase
MCRRITRRHFGSHPAGDLQHRFDHFGRRERRQKLGSRAAPALPYLCAGKSCRERAEVRETKLRAQTVEAENKALQAENERRRNVELLSEIGKEITASLDVDTIFYKLYERANHLADAYRRLDRTLQNLKATQEQLVTQQKLASLGQLAAGIAHEIKNPLNFVNNTRYAALQKPKDERHHKKLKRQKCGIFIEQSLRKISLDGFVSVCCNSSLISIREAQT